MPDRTFTFGLVALLLSLIALGYLLFWPALEVTEVVDGVITYSRESLLESANLWGILISAFPTLIVGGSLLTLPRSGRWQRNHKINVALGTVVIWVYVVMFSPQVGIVYVPSATMLTAVVVLMYVRPRVWGKGDFASDEDARAAALATVAKAPKRRRRRRALPDAVGRRPKRSKGGSLARRK